MSAVSNPPTCRAHVAEPPRSSRLTRLVLEVLHTGIGSGKDERLMTVVRPAHDVRRGAVVVTDLEDLAVPHRAADVGASDDQPVADSSEHACTFLLTGGPPGLVPPPAARCPRAPRPIGPRGQGPKARDSAGRCPRPGPLWTFGP